MIINRYVILIYTHIEIYNFSTRSKKIQKSSQTKKHIIIAKTHSSIYRLSIDLEIIEKNINNDLYNEFYRKFK